MQLNTIAGRTYNDLSQYPVVRARSAPPTRPSGRPALVHPSVGTDGGQALSLVLGPCCPRPGLCLLPLRTPLRPTLFPSWPVFSEGESCPKQSLLLPYSPFRWLFLPVGCTHLPKGEGRAGWAGRPSGPSCSSCPGGRPVPLGPTGLCVPNLGSQQPGCLPGPVQAHRCGEPQACSAREGEVSMWARPGEGVGMGEGRASADSPLIAAPGMRALRTQRAPLTSSTMAPTIPTQQA